MINPDNLIEIGNVEISLSNASQPIKNNKLIIKHKHWSLDQTMKSAVYGSLMSSHWGLVTRN